MKGEKQKENKKTKKRKRKNSRKNKISREKKMIQRIGAPFLSGLVIWALYRYGKDIGVKYSRWVWVVSYVVLTIAFEAL